MQRRPIIRPEREEMCRKLLQRETGERFQLREIIPFFTETLAIRELVLRKQDLFTLRQPRRPGLR